MADTEVKLGVDRSELQTGMQEASASVQDSLAKIADALQKFGGDNKRVTEEAIKNNADLSRSFLELKGSMTGGFNAIAGVIERFRGVIGTLAGALAGGLIGKEAVASMLAMEDAVRGLEIVMGVGAEKATQLATQLKLAGVGAREFEMMAVRTGMVMRTQPELFEQFGIKTRDASGALLSMDEVLKNVYDRMQDFKAGADQDMFALTFVRRGAIDFASDMERMSRTQERATELMREFGIEMGPARQAEIEEYRLRLNTFNVLLEEIGVRVGEVLLPGLLRLGEWFREVGPAAIAGAVQAVKVFATALEVVVQAVYYVIRSLFGLVEVFQSISKGWGAMASAAKTAIDDIVRYNAEGVDRINKLWSGVSSPTGGAAAAPIPKSGKLSFPSLDKAGADTTLAQWKDELTMMNLENGAFHELSKRNEQEFWEEKLSLIKGYSDQEIKLRQEVNKLILEARNRADEEEYRAALAHFARMIKAASGNEQAQMRLEQQRVDFIKAVEGEGTVNFEHAEAEKAAAADKWAKYRIAIAKAEQDQIDDYKKAGVAMTKLIGDQQLALGLINNQQRIAMETKAENDLYAIQADGYERELALAEGNELAQEQILVKYKRAYEEHQLALTKLEQQAELDRMRYALEAVQAVQNDFASLFANLADHTKKFSDIWKDFVKNLTSSLNQVAGKALADQLFGKGTTGGGFLTDLFGKIFGISPTSASKDVALDANTLALKDLTAALGTASLGGAGGAFGFSTGSLDLFGAGTGPFSALGGIFGGFFEQGTAYVPRTSLAVVHKGEAIIPAAYNRLGLGGGGMSVVNQFAINGPVDTRTQDQISHAAMRSIRRAASRIA